MSKDLDSAIDPTQVDQPILTRDQMLAIEDDPSKMETVARMLGAVNLDNLFRHMQNPTINPMARIEFQKMLNKLVNVCNATDAHELSQSYAQSND